MDAIWWQIFDLLGTTAFAVSGVFAILYHPAQAAATPRALREARLKVSPAFSKAAGCRGSAPVRAPQSAELS